RFDPASGQLVVTPFAEVRDELVRRWRENRQDLLGRDQANRILATWAAGRRDKGAEGAAVVRDLGAIPYPAAVGVGPASRAITDTLRGRAYDTQAEVVTYPGGYAVANAYELVERVTPNFEQIRPSLEEKLRQMRDDEEMRRAKDLYDRNQATFSGTSVYY